MIYIKDNLYILETKSFHYVFENADGVLHHLHFGKKCDIDDYCYYEQKNENSNHPVRDLYREEFTYFGGTMYRESDLKLEFPDKTRELDLVFDFTFASKMKIN